MMLSATTRAFGVVRPVFTPCTPHRQLLKSPTDCGRARRRIARVKADEGTGSSEVSTSQLSSQVQEAQVIEQEAEPEVTFLETSGSNLELAVSLLLGFTLIYAPLTMASIGKRVWFKTKFTNKRVIVTNSSPLFKNTVQVAYSKLKEVRSAPVAFGMWGNMVLFLKDGSRLELTGLPNVAETRAYIEARVLELETKQRELKIESLSA